MMRNKKEKSSTLDDVGFAAVKGTSIFRLGRKNEKITLFFLHYFCCLVILFSVHYFFHLAANSTKTLPSIMS